jgi:rhomboid protease GluP
MDNPQSRPQTTPERPAQQSEQLVALRLPTSRPIATYALLAIIVVVYMAQLVTNQTQPPADQLYGRQPLLDFGAIDFYRILLYHEYYRLFTAMFLHVNQIHIFFNAIALWSFGQSVERFFGHARFLLIYFLGGLCGSVASFLLTRGSSVGASAAIFAIIGADMVFLFHNRRLLGPGAQRELRSLIILALINFGIGLYTQFAPGRIIIDNWAHIGGFLAGIALSWFIAPRYRLQTDLSTPTGYRVEDANPLTRTWAAPAIFGVALFAILLYALGNISPLQ